MPTRRCYLVTASRPSARLSSRGRPGLLLGWWWRDLTAGGRPAYGQIKVRCPDCAGGGPPSCDWLPGRGGGVTLIPRAGGDFLGPPRGTGCRPPPRGSPQPRRERLTGRPEGVGSET